MHFPRKQVLKNRTVCFLALCAGEEKGRGVCVCETFIVLKKMAAGINKRGHVYIESPS